uniref:Serine/threonine protein kinase n=1 Tax=Marseillevirus LCMAC202 TaxID=2506606 RepID=A0A481YYQ8_9VIRU|nr:MAG: serine/threonine protein kinase [Marseillevirus LCMAC202]
MTTKSESRRIRDPPKDAKTKNNAVIIKKAVTSTVHINIKTRMVTKHVHAYRSHQVFEREVYWLKYLNENGYTWCPKLLSSNPEKKTIRMAYVGTPITKKNAPQNWKEQLQQILDDLETENIQHNDIKRSEILIKNGQLSLVDYGWASKGTDWSCGQRFDERVKPCHIFHDSTAIQRISPHLQ